MAEYKTMAQEMEDILVRLRELERMDFPQYRTYKRSDGTWVDHEPVPEYLEQKELIRRYEELLAIKRYFDTFNTYNPLMVSVRLLDIENNLKDAPDQIDLFLLSRIARSVYKNAPVTFEE